MASYDDPIPANPGDGNVRGDTKPMPDRGTSTGMAAYSGTYGASLDMNATNAMGSAHLSSDPMDRVMPAGDADLRFSASTHSSPDPATHFKCESDPMDEVMPEDPRGSPDPDSDY